MKAIGGYFELELNKTLDIYHQQAIPLNSGRNSLLFFLLNKKEIKKVYIPEYSCSSIVETLKKINANYEYYSIGTDFSPLGSNSKVGSYILFINYFGILNHKIEELRQRYEKIILDNSQAFFSNHYIHFPSFYSPRKFFGVPDGGFLYAQQLKIENLKEDKSGLRIRHLTKRIEAEPEKGYQLFLKNEQRIGNLPVRKMSELTRSLLQNINYDKALKKRNQNFLFLHKNLRDLNQLSPVIDKEKINGPMVYPFLTKDSKRFRNSLLKNRIYTATYWSSVLKLSSKSSYAYKLADNLIPLPIDQRYSIDDMKIILKFI